MNYFNCFLLSALILSGNSAYAQSNTSSDNEEKTITITTVSTDNSDGKSSTTTFSTTETVENKSKFKIVPRGRLLIDGALYAPDGNGFSDGVAMPDIRLGAKATFGKWTALAELGFGFGKLSVKDVWLQYAFTDEHLLRGGYFIQQFGLNAATSASMKPAMLAPTSDTFFACGSRNIGLQYIFDSDKWFVGASVMAAGNSMTKRANEQGKISVGATNRTIFRPVHSDGSIAQIGCSFWYQSAMHERVVNENGEPVPSDGYFKMSANFPTEVSSVSMLEADVRDASGIFKLSPEWLFTKGRISLEGQYYYMNIARKHNLSSYSANGVFALLRGILIGKDYGYTHTDAALATPGPKSLELIVGYNYTNANCRKADILGGISNDYSATLNYYINKYVIARLRYSYTDVRGSSVIPDRHVNTIQARIQVIF